MFDYFGKLADALTVSIYFHIQQILIHNAYDDIVENDIEA